MEVHASVHIMESRFRAVPRVLSQLYNSASSALSPPPPHFSLLLTCSPCSSCRSHLHHFTFAFTPCSRTEYVTPCWSLARTTDALPVGRSLGLKLRVRLTEFAAAFSSTGMPVTWLNLGQIRSSPPECRCGIGQSAVALDQRT